MSTLHPPISLSSIEPVTERPYLSPKRGQGLHTEARVSSSELKADVQADVRGRGLPRSSRPGFLSFVLLRVLCGGCL